MIFGYTSVDKRVEKVLKEHFDYSVDPVNQEVFQGIVKQGMDDLVDKYSMAIFYMLVMMNSLENDGSKEVKSFLTMHKYNIFSLHDKTDNPSAILKMLNEILKKQGIEEIDF